jgi:phosphatidylglycerol:prolipoprotein diacylglycerol transferase
MFISLCVSGLAGAYLVFVAFHFHDYLHNPWRFLNVFAGGLVFFGGLLGILIVAFFYPGRHGFAWRPSMDALAMGLPVGQSIGRIGCFLAGCCSGRPSDLPWAVHYSLPRFSNCQRLHPTQLYEALLLLLVFAVVYLQRRRKRFDGQTMLTYLFLASWVRFGLEFFRAPADYRGPIFWGMPMTQIFALFLALTSGVLWIWGWRHLTRKTGAQPTT